MDMITKMENLQQVVDWANSEYDGHLTIMKFTTGWKVVYGTPQISKEEREILNDLPSKMKFDEAVGVANELNRSFILDKPNF